MQRRCNASDAHSSLFLGKSSHYTHTHPTPASTSRRAQEAFKQLPLLHSHTVPGAKPGDLPPPKLSLLFYHLAYRFSVCPWDFYNCPSSSLFSMW